MFKSGFKSKNKKSSAMKSKGERLGWDSLKDSEPVKLRNILLDGEVVKTFNNSPMLVP